jgi:hypothetical protein
LKNTPPPPGKISANVTWGKNIKNGQHVKEKRKRGKKKEEGERKRKKGEVKESNKHKIGKN